MCCEHSPGLRRLVWRERAFFLQYGLLQRRLAKGTTWFPMRERTAVGQARLRRQAIWPTPWTRAIWFEFVGGPGARREGGVV